MFRGNVRFRGWGGTVIVFVCPVGFNFFSPPPSHGKAPSEIGEELGFTCKYDKFDRVLAKRVVVKGGFRHLFLEVYISNCFFFSSSLREVRGGILNR